MTGNLQQVLPAYFTILFTPQAKNVLLLCLFSLLTIFVFFYFFKVKRIIAQKHTFLEIKPSNKTLKSNLSTQQLFTIIHSINKPTFWLDKFLHIKKILSFELISSKEDGIRYIVRAPLDDVSLFKKSLLAYLPSVEIKEVEDYIRNKSNTFALRELELTKPYVFPLRNQLELNDFDPIAYITGQMTKMSEDEQLAIQIVATPVTSNSHSNITNHIQAIKNMIAKNEDINSKVYKNIFFDMLDEILSTKRKKLSDLSASRKNSYTVLEEKINQPLFETSIRILAISNTSEDSFRRIKGITSSFDSFSSFDQSFRLKLHIKNRILDRINYYLFRNRLLSFNINPILSISELSGIYHFPYTLTTKTEDLVKNKSPKLPAPLSFKKKNTHLDITFAQNEYGETVTSIGLTLEERRRHMYVIGATGTGKTTLLTRMIYHDIFNGKGVAVLDPHGDLAERLLGVIPKERLNDVIYFNPFDITLPIGLNVLEMTQGLPESERLREKDLITSSLISVFHKLYPARYSGPRMEHILRNTVLTALETENPTLFTVYKLLTNEGYRKQIVGKLIDQILKDFWKQEFESLGSYQKAEMISPITNKLGRFLTTSLTRNILNQQKSKLNFEDIMNNGKILICDLSKGKIGEDTSSFLGSLIIAKIQLAALNRVHIPIEQREDFFLYIDEFQNFATMTFAQILSEARKYRLNTILAHQTISQIEDKDLLKVILANVGTVISFRTSNPSDEDIILPLFTPQVERNEISNLPSYNFYIKINALSPEDAFTGSINDFTVTSSQLIRQSVITQSQQTYGSEIEKLELPVENNNPVKTTKPKKKIEPVVHNKRVSI